MFTVPVYLAKLSRQRPLVLLRTLTSHDEFVEFVGSLIRQVSNQSRPYPSVRIVALIPIDADRLCYQLNRHPRPGDGTYNDLRPAIRGMVAQEPPSTMLCFPSKKSATDIVRALILNMLLKGIPV